MRNCSSFFLLMAASLRLKSNASATSFIRPSLTTRLSSRPFRCAAQLRGGDQGYPSSSDSSDQPYSEYQPPSGYVEDENLPIHETVQERLDTWKTRQQEQASSDQYYSPRDEKGRMKLMTSVSKGSRAIIFFLLMIRNIHLYELADKLRTGIPRLVCVIPMVVMFVANLAGVVVSLTSPSHSAKKRLKAILNLDKMIEVVLICFYLIRLTIFPPSHTPRELYIANIFHSIFFLLQSQAFTRLSWDENAAQPINSYTQQQPGVPVPPPANAHYETVPQQPTYMRQ